MDRLELRRRWPRRLAIALPIGLAIAIVIQALIPKPTWIPDMGDRSQLEPIAARSITGSQATLTDALRSHTYTVHIDERDTGLVVDALPLECHGGRIRITWHIGNLEPQIPTTGIHLSARLDGERVGTLLRGSTDGIWNDDPATIEAVADCPAGQHLVDLHLDSVTGRWGFPYVVTVGGAPDPDRQVNRGFIVEEIWSP